MTDKSVITRYAPASATFPLRGRLREVQHFEEDPNAARCPTGSTSLRMTGYTKPPSGREGDRGAVEGARRE